MNTLIFNLEIEIWNLELISFILTAEGSLIVPKLNCFFFFHKILPSSVIYKRKQGKSRTNKKDRQLKEAKVTNV